MEGLKQIMYGVTDFARMRTKNGYFVGRTDLFRELEKTSYTVFLRPRRFGKSLLVSSFAASWSSSTAVRPSAAKRFDHGVCLPMKRQSIGIEHSHLF